VRTDPGCKYTRWEEDKVCWLAYGWHILLQLDNSDALDRYLDDIEDRIKAFSQWGKELVAKPKATRLTVSVGGRTDHQDMPRNGPILREVRNKKGVTVEELVRIVGKMWTMLFLIGRGADAERAKFLQGHLCGSLATSRPWGN
jgi:hypothetical protein